MYSEFYMAKAKKEGKEEGKDLSNEARGYKEIP
jgi:hypothetical protein